MLPTVLSVINKRKFAPKLDQDFRKLAEPMKLRTRETPARARAARARPVYIDDHDSDVEEVEPEVEEAPLALRRPPRRSVAPRFLAQSPAPTPARPRPRATPKAPKGGVQKRKVTRARTRPAATRTRRARQTIPEHVKEVGDNVKEGKEDEVEMEQDDYDDKLNGADNEKAEGDKEKRAATIDDLPEEVMLGIFSYFRPPQLCWKIGRVCQRWASWSVAPLLWRGKDYILSPHPNLSSRRNK
ncbi:F-box/LRR-repeat protein 5 [Frankliniella fusca]|uniref:F-box/LRR-repeat protein 5 n=1 Tax=Frankliniella fusca TaxID=407009 RepID=A0AAE1H3H9_9NEOP|nr:F-box/LRR-repeat protein 5 [Frankliniella fusca]